MAKKREVIQLDRESVIPIHKPKLIKGLANLIDDGAARSEFLTFSKRVEYTVRAWYLVKFEEMMQLYSLFDPIHGTSKLEQQGLCPEEIDELEEKFLKNLFEMMDKSNFKLVTNEEIEVALSGKYRVNFPVKVDETKIDKRLLRRFFANNPQENLPYFADQYIIFRRGIGIDRMTAYFYSWKVDTILSRIWQGFLRLTGLKRCFSSRRRTKYMKNQEQLEEICTDEDENDLYVERIRIQNMRLSISKLLGRVTIQEPTFERIIIIYRLASIQADNRGIYVKHFKKIPMADMEIVLPEKKNPGLTALDWVKFLVSAAIGLVTYLTLVYALLCSIQTFITCLVPMIFVFIIFLSFPLLMQVTLLTQLKKKHKANIRVLAAVGSAVVGYCSKTYFTFQKNLSYYQNLITRSMYEKQLDSGRGTLLHLCDEVIQQEVKEVILSFFILMEQGETTRQDLDRRCEELLKNQFKQDCNFDVDDAIQKLQKLGIVERDADGRYSCVAIKRANEIIGTTTEELVIQAEKGANFR